MKSVDISKTILELDVPFTIRELHEVLYRKYKVEIDSDTRGKILEKIDELREVGLLEEMKISKDDYKFCNPRVMNYVNTRISTPGAKEDEIYYQSDFTSFEFLYLLVALFNSLEINTLNPYDLEEFIKQCKEKNLFTRILEAFGVVEQEGNKYIWNLYKAFNNCEDVGLLTASTKEYNIPLELPTNYSIEKVFQHKVKYIKEMLLFIKEYNKYLCKDKRPLQKQK